MHAALNVVEVFLNKLVIVAAFLMPLAVWCVWLAAAPSYREFWDTRKAGELSQKPSLIPSASTEVWTFWQKTGFSVFTKGKEDIFEGFIPQLDCTEPLSEAVFQYLQDEIRAIAKKKRDSSLSDMSWSSRYFVIDSYCSSAFEKGLCTPEVVSLQEHRYFYADYAAHGSAGMLGRNFIWHDSSMLEIELTDLFDESSGRDWFAVLAKEVEADLRRQGYSEFDGYLPFEQFDQFLITGEGLKIIFQEYAFYSGFGGFPAAYVSWDRLSSVLKPDAPVTRWCEEQLQKR